MKRFTRLSSTALLAAFLTSGLSLTGCSYIEPYKSEVTQGNIITNEALGLLQEGLSKDQVRTLFGPPMGGENPFNPSHWEFLYYNFHGENHSEVQERIIVNFDNEGYVKTWDRQPVTVELQEDKGFFGLGLF